MNRDFGLSSVELGKDELRVVLCGRQNMSDLMFKKELLLVITELDVISKCLDQLYDQLCHPQPACPIWKNEQYIFCLKTKKNLLILDKF